MVKQMILGERFASMRAIWPSAGLKTFLCTSAPLLRGNDAYAAMEPKRRAAYLASFGTFVQHSPFTYHVFVYRKSEFRDVHRSAPE